MSFTSDIVTFRDNVVAAIKTGVPELNGVDWYDGLFDEKDIEEWVVDVPYCFVSVGDIMSTPHSTGEMNLALPMLVTIITQDYAESRDADAQVWAIMEKVALIANKSKFGNINAAVGPQKVSLGRLRNPEMRRQGVAIGVVEWSAGLTIGSNDALLYSTIYDPNAVPVTTMSQNITANETIRNKVPTTNTEVVKIDLSDDAL